MRDSRNADDDLGTGAILAATGLVSLAVVALTTNTVATVQLAALEQCAPNCNLGGPALPLLGTPLGAAVLAVVVGGIGWLALVRTKPY
jgi:hypothetical protein